MKTLDKIFTTGVFSTLIGMLSLACDNINCGSIFIGLAVICLIISNIGIRKYINDILKEEND